MDPFIWVCTICLPILCILHGWLFAMDKYPGEIELVVFQLISAGCTLFVIVWRLMHPIDFFWIPSLLLFLTSAAWVPLNYRAQMKSMKTYCWSGTVFLTPLLYASACIMLTVTPSESIGDNFCITCTTIATVCQAIYAQLVHNTIPLPDNMYYSS